LHFSVVPDRHYFTYTRNQVVSSWSAIISSLPFLQVRKTIHLTQVTCWLGTATCACCARTHSTHCRFFLAILQPSIRSRTQSSFATDATVTSRQSGACLLTTVVITSPQHFQIRLGMMETTIKKNHYSFHVLEPLSVYLFTQTDRGCSISKCIIYELFIQI
jgi:hypothetical protein